MLVNTDTWDVIVVGGGPAGLSAALQLGRADRRVLVVDAGEGRNRFADHMHGVLGSDGVSPFEFVARGREEVSRYGVETLTDVVTSVSEDGDTLRVVTEKGAEFATRRLIATSGCRDGVPDVPGAIERWGRDLLHCPYCHGWESRGGRLGVLASSSASIHQAMLVRQWSDNLVFFSAAAGDLPVDVSARLAARGVLVESRAATRLIVTDDRLTGVELDGGAVIPVDALFTTPVLKSNEEYLSSLGLEREQSKLGGFVKTDKSGRTSNPRVWAVGNVARPAETVPMVLAAGAAAGAAVNMDLIEEEFELALDEQLGAPAGGAPTLEP